MPQTMDIRRHRIKLVTEVQLSFPDMGGFLQEYSSNISLGGIFIQSEAPQPVGSDVQLEFTLDNHAQLIKGRGEVIWTRKESQGPDKPAGMGIRFKALDERGRKLILQLMEKHIQAGGEPFDIRKVPGEEPAAQGAAASEGAATVVFGPGSLPKLPPPAGPAAPAVRPAAPTPMAGGLPQSPQGESPAPPAPLQGDPPLKSPIPFRPPSPTPVAPMNLPQPKPTETPWYATSNPAFLTAAIMLVLALGTLAFFVVNQGPEPGDVLLPSDLMPASRPAYPVGAATSPPVEDGEPSSSPPEVALVPSSAEDNGSSSAPSRDPVSALTRVESIAVERQEGSTLLRIQGNGPFHGSNYSHFRLEAGSFREVIRILGINEPYVPSRFEAGTPQVDTIRTGLHQLATANELHVVLDLADQQARVTRIQPQGGTLLIWLN